jgi:hypothetical protein
MTMEHGRDGARHLARHTRAHSKGAAAVSIQPTPVERLDHFGLLSRSLDILTDLIEDDSRYAIGQQRRIRELVERFRADISEALRDVREVGNA